jgi:hypothetical protein
MIPKLTAALICSCAGAVDRGRRCLVRQSRINSIECPGKPGEQISKRWDIEDPQARSFDGCSRCSSALHHQQDRSETFAGRSTHPKICQGLGVIADSLSEFLAEQLDRSGRAVLCRGWSRQVAASGRDAIKRQTLHHYGVEWPVPSSGETSYNRIFSRGHLSMCKECGLTERKEPL